MKADYNKKRYHYSFIILLILFWMTLSFENGYSRTKKIVYNPSVCNIETKTCFNLYCHSNGKGEYRTISWDPPTLKLDCNGCHGAPPKTENHQNASLKTCGQRCHRETIKNGYTTSFHINGKVEGEYEGIDVVDDERDCLECHYEKQGEYPAVGMAFEMFMDPASKISSNHVGGQPMNQHCKVCHMEEFPEFHQNMAVELKNHNSENQQERNYYKLDKYTQLENLSQLEYSEYINQFNKFCLDCHFTGVSLFGSNPFNTSRPPIPVIQNELLNREVPPDKLQSVRFWYSHNHITEDLSNGKQIMNQTDPDSMMNNQMGSPMDNGLNPQQIMDNSGPNSMFKDEMKGYMDNGMGGSGGSKQRKRMGIPVVGIGGGMPITGPVTGTPIDPIPGSNPAAIIANQPTPIAPVPLMGVGTAPGLGVPGSMPLIPPTLPGGGMISQQVPGILAPSPAIVPGGGTSMLPGIEIMIMTRSGPGPMIMGPGITPLLNPGSMIMAPVITPGFLPMSGSMIMDPTRMDPMMIMDPMMRNGPMNMYHMNMDEMMRNAPMNMYHMNMDEMMRNAPMNMYHMNMDEMMRNAPMNMNQYYPQHMDKPDTNNPPNNNNPPTEIIQNNGTASCLACHTHEDTSMLEYSLIIKIFHGHFSHQNCIVCHVPHGSQFPGLLRDRINWNKENRSCSIEGCHEPYVHEPPLEGTMVHYEIRPEATCNVESCHIGSIHKDEMAGYNGVMTGK